MSLAAGEPVMRWRLAAAAASAGVPCRLGGAQPHGRRIVVRGAEMVDTSARWRGRVLWREPAQLAPDESRRLAEAAARVQAALAAPGSGPALEFDLAPEPVLVAAGGEDPGCGAVVWSGEPAATAARAVGSLARCEGAEPLVAGALDLPAWTPVARIAAGDRAELRVRAEHARIDGLPTSLALLRACLAAAGERPLRVRDLDAVAYAPCAIEVLAGGLHTTIQDWPGRVGHWAVGVPPSGPFDDLAFRLANRLVGNPPGSAGLEVTLSGPTLRFHVPALIALAGCPVRAELDGAPLPAWRAVAVQAGAVLRIAGPGGTGVRCSLAVRGGLVADACLGSAATFDLGRMGGLAGRPLAAGDWLPLARAVPAAELAACPPPLPPAARPAYGRRWTLGVLEGPHTAPDFLTAAGMSAFYAATWRVHHHSNRTGIRLIGPKPLWARSDGGEAGLHPSNIHDNAYAFGAVDLTGDMPIILGPDGPSCGGFVCPLVVAQGERWKLGQLRPGDTLRFARLDQAAAAGRRLANELLVEGLEVVRAPPRPPAAVAAEPAVILARPAAEGRPPMCVRRAGDDFVLLEYGDPELDLGLRLRVALLEQRLRAQAVAGIIELVPGVRSLQVHHDPARLGQPALADLLAGLDAALPPAGLACVPSRTVHLPLSWDDPATRTAIDIYMRSVRADAPWCPWNIEFIRRINGLDSVDEVKRIVFAAEYLVLGLGDVYLGAPVATPVDPRHRLVTTKYNPARTWTPENAVGIGGAYLCIYGMEGPGGYQFVGRTVPVWRTAAPAPALLRNFDRIRWHEVSATELLDLRADCRAGRWAPRIEDGVFDGGAYARFLDGNAEAIAAFRRTQRAAFAAERERWSLDP
jgi:urea carboxylase